jgi:DNA-binding protein H-NS
MADIDLQALSLQELQKLQKDLDRAIASFEARKKAEARAALEAKAREFGFSLSEIVEGGEKKARTPAKAKFHHPDDPSITWSGRGRRPAWAEHAVEI